MKTITKFIYAAFAVFAARQNMKTRSATILATMVTSLVALASGSEALAQGETWTTKTPMPTARYGPATGVIDGKLYVAGGAVVFPSYPYPRFTNLEVYDLTTDAWTTKAPIPIGVYASAAGVINGKLYVAGGQASNTEGDVLATLQVYDPLSDTWTTNAPMPVPTHAAVAGVIDGKLYVAGGHEGFFNGGFTTALRVYDPATDTWTTKASMSTARIFAGGAVVGGMLYAVGGLNDLGPMTTVEAYDPVADSWTTKAPLVTPRWGPATGVMNGVLYAAGGSDSSVNFATMEAYDPITNVWTTKASMPTARMLPGAEVFDGVLYVVGGRDESGGNIAANEAFTPTPIYVAQVQQPIDPDGSSVFNVRRGVVPVKFSLTQGGVATCALPPATIALTRTAGGTTGEIDESVYIGSADSGSNFRIDSCQYIYNLSANSLGVGTYRVDIKIDGNVVGSAVFQLK